MSAGLVGREGLADGRVLGLLEAAADGVAVVDAVGTVLWANRSAQEVLSPERPDRSLVGRPLGRPVLTGESQPLSIPGPDGRTRSVEMVATEVVVEDGTAYVVTLRDLTRHLRALRDLRRRREREDETLTPSRTATDSPTARLRLPLDELGAGWGG